MNHFEGLQRTHIQASLRARKLVEVCEPIEVRIFGAVSELQLIVGLAIHHIGASLMIPTQLYLAEQRGVRGRSTL